MSQVHPSNSASAPVDFEESPLFYGRWTMEEEKYAEMMISEFRDGNLDDTEMDEAPNTLRGFLAAKLRCAPKRISKKFESSGYNGRMQYVCKKATIDPEESETRHQELETLRQGFEARRSGLPKKPLKKKHSKRSTSDATVESATAKASPFFTPSSLAPEAALPALMLGTAGILSSRPAASFVGPTTSALPSLLASSLHAQRAASTDALLGNSFLPGLVSERQASLFSPPRPSAVEWGPGSDAAILSSLLQAPSVSSMASNQLLAAEALKRRMENARLYALLQQRDSANTLQLSQQIAQRKRLQEALANAAHSSSTTEQQVEGPPAKRPRAA